MTFVGGRKKQLLVLQPRGKALYDDDSSFGSKMLAKMGWNKGSGLGKEQHGSIDFIQVRYKNNANGLGYDGLKDNQWTENESQFDSLLKNLNGNSASNSSDEASTKKSSAPKSLEERSKASRARVHYKKFTKGKDVHKYSEKDLANILGKKTLKEVEPEVQETAEIEIVEEKPDVYESNLIINTGLSVTDYFKQKMQQKSSKVSAAELKEERNQEYRASFAQAQDNADSNDAEAAPSKKKKKRKLAISEDDSAVPEPESAVTEEPTKKKKKKLETTEADAIVPEPVADATEEPIKKKKKKLQAPEADTTVPEPEADATEEPIKKKKKKSRRDSDVIEVIDLVEEESEVPKKSKKSQKNSEVEIPFEESPPPSEKKSKKQKNKVEEAPAPISTEPEASPVEAPKDTTKASKKSKKAGEPQRPMGANAVYSTNVVQIPTHVAQKLSCIEIDKYKNSNVGAIVGYGLTEDIEIKVVQTKVGDNSLNTDKYSLYNTDRIFTKQRDNPRKILSKLKKTKKSIKVL